MYQPFLLIFLSLKRKKSLGLDYLPLGLLKDCVDEITEPLHYTINPSNSYTVHSYGKKQELSHCKAYSRK